MKNPELENEIFKCYVRLGVFGIVWLAAVLGAAYLILQMVNVIRDWRARVSDAQVTSALRQP